MLFADDQVLLAKSEDDLQYSVHNLNKTASKFSMEINVEKTIVMAFRGMEPVISKICINNKTLKQQNTFNYLGYNISYEGETVTVFYCVSESVNVTSVKLHAAGRYQSTRYASPDTKPIHTYKHPEV
jgi:hypothetical protein